MEFKFQITLLVFYLIILNIKCENNYKVKEKQNNDLVDKKQPLNRTKFPINNIINDMNLKPNTEKLKIGMVHDKILNYQDKYNFIFSNYEKEDKALLINFYPLDCPIEIETENYDKRDNNLIDIKRIDNYEYDSFFASIPNINLNNILFKIKVLTLMKERTENRICNLIINSIEINNEYKEIPKLLLKEKNSTLIHFNESFTKIKLLYEINNEKNQFPIVFSFFIKEKVKFQFEIENYTKNIIKKTISYIDNIIIFEEDININKEKNFNLTIKISNLENKVSNMIVRVINNNTHSVLYLQKNILNLGFIFEKNRYQYYYMKVFEGEEGEIILHNKRKNGMLISKIDKKGNSTFPSYKEINFYLEDKDYLEYNEFTQKLSFNSNHTSGCSNGCNILISYNTVPCENSKIIGTEYTLLTRIWDKEEFIPQIINIPLNEYVLGSFDITSINHHYFSIFIPNDSEKITVEIQGKNIEAFAAKGIKKINIYNKVNNSVHLTEEDDEKWLINLNSSDFGLKSLKDKYISFSFFPKNFKLENFTSYYYFRVLSTDSRNNYTIYPLNTNKANICKPDIIGKNSICFFLFKNDYQDAYFKFRVYAIKDKLKYTEYLINDIDYYSFSLNNLSDYHNYSSKLKFLTVYIMRNETKNKEYEIKKMEKIKKLSFIIIKIEYETNEENDILTVYSGYSNRSFTPSLQIYSYQLLLIYGQKAYKFWPTLSNKYKILIDSIFGREGNFTFKEEDNSTKTFNLFGQKFSFPLNHKIKEINFNIEKNETSIVNNTGYHYKYKIFVIKIIYQKTTSFLEEIKYDLNIKKLIKYEEFPNLFYIKDIQNSGIDINFDFINDNTSINFEIRGYTVDYRQIEDIIEDEIIEKEEIEQYKLIENGLYDNITKKGIISFNHHNHSHKNIDEYFLVEINPNDKIINYNFDINLFVIPKKNSKTLIPYNKYMRGSFNLLKDSYFSQEYHIDMHSIYDNQQDNNNKKIIFEFSSNYEHIGMVFNENMNLEIKNFKDLKIYIISTKELSFNFTIKINKIENIKNKQNTLEKVNYIFKYYDEKYQTDFDLSYDCEKINKNKYKFINKNEVNSNKNLIYNYYLSAYKEKNILENELLNTIAIITSKKSDFYQKNNHQLDKDLIFNVENLKDNENYIISLFVIIENKQENIEIYRAINFPIDTNKNNKVLIRLIFAIIGLSVFILIIIIIVIFIYRKLRKKNKNLEETVRAISFSSGVEERESISSKNEDDYENTFI